MAIRLRVALLRCTVPLAAVAAGLVREKAWFSSGFARADDFARERLGRSRRWLGDLAALHDAMQVLPGLEPALTGVDGGRPIGGVAALLIGRIAAPASTSAWVNLARRSTVRELRAAIVRARDAGLDSPADGSSFDGVDSSVRGGLPGSGDSSAERHDDSSRPNHAIRGRPRINEDSTTADDCEAGTLVRVEVPRAIRAAFDEAVDLFRAVEGTEATATSFIEALVAESSTGPCAGDAHHPPTAEGPAGAPHDIDTAAITPGPLSSVIEAALARSTNNWRHLPDAVPFSPWLDQAEKSLAALDDLARRAGTGTPADLLEQMQALISLENDLEVRLGRLLAEMADQGAWARLRFAGLGHYAEERLGLSRTTAEDRARAGRVLHRFPRLREAYERDRIGLEAALTVARILKEGPIGIPSHDGSPIGNTVAEEAWLLRAREATVKRLRDDARLLLRRSIEAGNPDAAPGGKPLPPEDADWHASLSRAPGTSIRRIIRHGMIAAGFVGNGLTVTDLDDGGDRSPATALVPAPDVFLRLRLPHDLAAPFLAAIESARRRLTAAAEAIPWDAQWPDGAERSELDPAANATALASASATALPSACSTTLPSALAARALVTRCRRVPAWLGLLALLEDFILTWDTDARDASPPNDRIYVRDGWRCTAPGCSSRRNLESHHVVYRSQGGGDDASNRTTLCRFHHQRGEHGGLASCSGKAPLGLDWRLGRDDLGEWYRNERRLAAVAG